MGRCGCELARCFAAAGRTASRILPRNKHLDEAPPFLLRPNPPTARLEARNVASIASAMGWLSGPAPTRVGQLMSRLFRSRGPRRDLRNLVATLYVCILQLGRDLLR